MGICESQAMEAEILFQRQRRTRNFMDFIEFDRFLDRLGPWGQTKRTDGPLDIEAGTGFETVIEFKDGSHWTTKQLCFKDDSDQISFERRGDPRPAPLGT